MKKLVLSAISLMMFCISANAQNDNGGFLISSEGVGPVKIGMKASQLPVSVPGLYDKFVEENSDMVLYSFYLDGATVITTNGDQAIEMIEIFPDLDNVTTSDGVYSGMPAYEFKQKSGWKEVEQNKYEKDGVTVYIQEYEDSEPTVNVQVGEYESDF